MLSPASISSWGIGRLSVQRLPRCGLLKLGRPSWSGDQDELSTDMAALADAVGLACPVEWECLRPNCQLVVCQQFGDLCQRLHGVAVRAATGHLGSGGPAAKLAMLSTRDGAETRLTRYRLTSAAQFSPRFAYSSSPWCWAGLARTAADRRLRRRRRRNRHSAIRRRKSDHAARLAFSNLLHRRLRHRLSEHREDDHAPSRHAKRGPGPLRRRIRLPDRALTPIATLTAGVLGDNIGPHATLIVAAVCVRISLPWIMLSRVRRVKSVDELAVPS